MFDDVCTERRRFNHLKGLDAYIEPSQYPVGTANVQESVKGQIVIQPISLTGTIISPCKVLKAFLQLPGVLDQIVSYMNGLERENDIMENVVQGTLWNEVIKPKFGDKLVLPLTMSFDDVATNKDLGSHATVHKLSACHLTISCLPPVFASVLENLFLVLLFHSADKDFGMEEVFRPLLEELKTLEEEGIEIKVNNTTIRVYLALCLLIGDNLGLNTILGFVQGFTANYFCRICKCHKEATKIQCYENPEFLRTEQSFNRDVQRNDQVSTGVKSKCIWNELSSFSNTINLYVDIMHDIIEEKISYPELNDLIQGFYYGNEFGNKPPLVNEEKIKKDENVGFSASELLCLIRYFPLMIGHKINQEDKVWQFYLCLRELVEMLFAPTFPRSSIPYLIDLIANHHKQYMELSKKDLRPKFHHLVHYGRIIKKIGPLKPIWTMHSEAKYKELRLAAHVISSRVKIDYTLSVKSSLKLCARFTMQKGLVHRFTFAPYSEEIPIEHIAGHLNFKHLVPSSEKTWNVVKWVNVDGTTYKPDM
ncbi:Assembly factor cbp-4, partial [Frankliniella fusca]